MVYSDCKLRYCAFSALTMKYEGDFLFFFLEWYKHNGTSPLRRCLLVRYELYGKKYFKLECALVHLLRLWFE